jgi:hypothetical protein
MTNDPNELNRAKRSDHVSSKPPIFHLYEFFQERPVLIGTLAGVVAGLVAASQTGWPLNVAAIGGAVAGTIVAAIVLRLRPPGSPNPS